ncbi:lactosylceramide 4-alpha-galactosyltransferase-like [Eriocheir sinensis]|uniref:lactosylceramide 4-alpha-galactosyltransferase-like n=1 Tax=Eriocheir sinensis TaxID=95602 RepID=UPI0021C56877|nr:lactosylceramide 4-alpha-galactosyltransferase-like [Eriocheir sinensis]
MTLPSGVRRADGDDASPARHVESSGRRNDSPVCPSPPHGGYFHLPDVFSEVAKARSEYNVVLLESYCATTPSFRVWCALESLAQQNPRAYVWYVMVSGALEVTEGSLGALLPRRYPNLRPVTVTPAQVFSGTPLEALFESGTWRTNTSWAEVNLADLMRLALVWHLGGFYADSDVVCVRPVTHLADVVAWQEMSTIGSGAFHFRRQHPLLLQIMSRAALTFQAARWGAGGPHVFTSLVKQHCQGHGLAAGRAASCGDLTVLPIKAFYPVPAPVWKTIFMPQTFIRPVAQRYRGSYLIHTWNQLSRGQLVARDSGSIYDQAARQFCPLTRQLATAHSPFY